jgi:hypothetical protein
MTDKKSAIFLSVFHGAPSILTITSEVNLSPSRLRWHDLASEDRKAHGG